jgi:hypothetical protein
MYEHKITRPIARTRFVRRLFVHAAIAFGLIALSLALGMAGYCGLEHLAPLDGFLNSAMLLGGMGPVNAPVTPGGKLFAGLFALYAGLVFIVTAALLFTPLLHRLMHRFHWTEN